MINKADFYIVWSGSLNLGDTPGVFNNAQFVGLLLQIPITVTFVSPDVKVFRFLLETTDVEIFEQEKKHPIFWDWKPGTTLPKPVGFIDDQDDFISGRRELHTISIPRDCATEGFHTITIQVNPQEAAGLKDDFVLEKIQAENSIGAKIGW